VCKRHAIAARYADPLAIKLLARALTAPDKILALADAARTQEAEAVANQELAAARLDSATQRLAVLATERGKLTTALAALGALYGMDAQLAAVRERLAALDAEYAELDALAAQSASKRAGASDRVTFLRQMFTVRDGVFDYATGVLSYDNDTSSLAIGTAMHPAQAAALLGVPEDAIAALMPISADVLNDGTVEWVVATRDVVEQLLLRLSRDELRAVFLKLRATVVVSRPRPRAERNGKWTPPEARIALHLLRRVEVRTDDAQANTSV
jgi:multidrug efflux pump subunit AcrA (membrane-fusion protein)